MSIQSTTERLTNSRACCDSSKRSDIAAGWLQREIVLEYAYKENIWALAIQDSTVLDNATRPVR